MESDNINKLTRLVATLVGCLTLVSYLTLASTDLFAGVTAEQILGEYWNDPLFGQAATDRTVELEVLTGQIWPSSLTVQAGAKVRILVENKTLEPHLLVFSRDIDALHESEKFKSFVEDELFHAQQKKQQGSHHSHSGTNVDDAESIVKRIEQNPSVFVLGGDKKEVLVNFEGLGKVTFACMIESHRGKKNTGVISIE